MMLNIKEGNNMYLKEIHLENFKCFEKATVNFNKELSVIIGVNGSGKTSILDSIAIAVSTIFAQMNGPKALGINKTQAHLKSYSMRNHHFMAN